MQPKKNDLTPLYDMIQFRKENECLCYPSPRAVNSVKVMNMIY